VGAVPATTPGLRDERAQGRVRPESKHSLADCRSDDLLKLKWREPHGSGSPISPFPATSRLPTIQTEARSVYTVALVRTFR
jgi:hypothetical protein